MITVNIHEAKSQLSALLAAVEGRDEVVVICRHGKPVAELRPARGVHAGQPDPLQTHPELTATILYDPTEPASEGEWPSEAREGGAAMFLFDTCTLLWLTSDQTRLSPAGCQMLSAHWGSSMSRASRSS